MINPEAISVMAGGLPSLQFNRRNLRFFFLAKQPEPESHYSSSHSAAVKSEWIYDSISQVPSCCAQVKI